jgi:hypothetical protein
VSDAKGLRRRAELLLALANKAREDNYTQLADYILDRADQLFEEARIRELGWTAARSQPFRGFGRWAHGWVREAEQGHGQEERQIEDRQKDEEAEEGDEKSE